MKKELLEKEKFDTLKELADVQENISNGRAELLKLKETTKEYLVVREKEAEQRVIKVLRESKESLDETTKNHKELSKYNSDLKAYANELKKIASEIITLFKNFNESVDIADKNIKKKQGEVRELINMIKLERVSVQKDRKLLKGEMIEINSAWVLLRDRQETLKKGFLELKKITINK